MAHAATPNSEVSKTVTPASQKATSTVPDQIEDTSIAAGQNDSEKTKIVSTSPGV